MNNQAYISKRKNINYLIDNLLEFERNTKHLKNVVEWTFNDSTIKEQYLTSNDWLIEENCYYITDNHQIVIPKTAIHSNKTVFILKIDKIIKSLNDFFKIIPLGNKSNFVIISLDKISYEYKLLVEVNNVDIQFLSDLKLRKLNYCIDCKICQQECPITLVEANFTPILHIKNQIIEKGYVEEKLCMGCGKCDTKCPVGIPLSDYFLFYNKPKKWNENILHKMMNINSLYKYVFNFIK